MHRETHYWGSKKEISNLYKFIDWLIGLPKELEIDYLKNIYELEEAMNMPYITTAEQIGFEKGELKGKLDGKFEVAKEMLSEGCDPAFISKITKLPIEKIREIQKSER